MGKFTTTFPKSTSLHTILSMVTGILCFHDEIILTSAATSSFASSVIYEEPFPLPFADCCLLSFSSRNAIDDPLMNTLIINNQNSISRFTVFTEGIHVVSYEYSKFQAELALLFIIDTVTEIHAEEAFVDFAQFYDFQWTIYSIFFIIGRENLDRSTYGNYVLNLGTSSVAINLGNASELSHNTPIAFSYICSGCNLVSTPSNDLEHWFDPKYLAQAYLKTYRGKKKVTLQKFLGKFQEEAEACIFDDSFDNVYKCRMRYRVYGALATQHNFTYSYKNDYQEGEGKDTLEYWINFIGGPYNKLGLQSGPSSTSGQVFYETNYQHLIYCDLDKHDPQNNRLSIWITAFSLLVWMLTLACVFILTGLLLYFRWHREKGHMSTADAFIHVICVLIRQQSLNSRLLAILGIAGILLTTIYETTFTSVILVPILPLPVQTFQEMITGLNYKILYPYFNNGTVPPPEKVYNLTFWVRHLESRLNDSFMAILPSQEEEQYKWISPVVYSNDSYMEGDRYATFEDEIRVPYRLYKLHSNMDTYHNGNVAIHCFSVPEPVNMIHKYWDIKTSHRAAMGFTMVSLREAGLLKEWMENQFREIDTNISIYKESRKLKRTYIKFGHLTGILMIMAGVLVMSGIAFLFETQKKRVVAMIWRHRHKWVLEMRRKNQPWLEQDSWISWV